MTATIEVIAPGEPTLAELAATANGEHEQVVRHAEAMVEHAIRSGDALIQAKDRCPPGAWVTWLGDNFFAGHVTATIYMRLARYQDQIRAEGIRSVDGARKHLVGLPAAKMGCETHPKWMRDEAKRMIAEGASQRAVGSALGVHHATVNRWVDPAGWDVKRAERQRQWKAQRRAQERLERAEAIKRAVKKAGAATAEAWAMAERMQDVLAQAHRETEDTEARRALSEAGVHYRKMRDEIVRALGVS